MQITFDKKNYRKHSEQNKKRIRKSLTECGAGRSVLVDKDGCLIAGNGVYEQAEKMGIKTRIIETDGTELVVVKRTDIGTDDPKRKTLALADNATSDGVEWDVEMLQADFDVDGLTDWGIKLKGLKEAEVEGDVEFTEILDEENNYIVLKFDNDVDWIQACSILGIGRVREEYRSGSVRYGVGRVLNGAETINKLTNL